MGRGHSSPPVSDMTGAATTTHSSGRTVVGGQLADLCRSLHLLNDVAQRDMGRESSRLPTCIRCVMETTVTPPKLSSKLMACVDHIDSGDVAQMGGSPSAPAPPSVLQALGCLRLYIHWVSSRGLAVRRGNAHIANRRNYVTLVVVGHCSSLWLPPGKRGVDHEERGEW